MTHANQQADCFPAYLPTPEDIERECEAIRSAWTETEEENNSVYRKPWFPPQESRLFRFQRVDEEATTAQRRVYLSRKLKKLPDCNLCDSDYWQHAIG
jgi:hypothetical protein